MLKNRYLGIKLFIYWSYHNIKEEPEPCFKDPWIRLNAVFLICAGANHFLISVEPKPFYICNRNGTVPNLTGSTTLN